MCFRCYIQNPHTSMFTFTRRPSVGNTCKKCTYLSGTINNYKLLYSSIHNKITRQRQHSVSPVIFFLLSGMMAPHANSQNTPTSSRSSYGTPVRFVRLFCESEHTLDRTSLKMSLAFLPRCVYHFGTNRMQKKPYRPIIYFKTSYIAVTWAERSEGGEIHVYSGFLGHFIYYSDQSQCFTNRIA